MLIVTDSKHTRLTSVQQVVGRDDYTLHADSSYVVGFNKPDKAVINPKQHDGYRSPSPYSCPGIAFLNGRQTSENRFPRPYTINGSGQSSSTTRWTHTGSGVGNVRLTLAPLSVDALRTKLLNNVRNEVLDVAMVLAEMQGTTDTIMNGLMRIARTMDAFKKGNPHHYSYLLSGRRKDNRRPTDKFLRESSGLFLEWKYGIMPTVYDVQGACKALDMNEDGSLWNNPPLLVARAVTTDRSVQESDITIGTVMSGVVRKASHEVTRQSSARLDYSIRGEGIRGLNRYGLGLSTIPTLLFEKTPFSFVLNMAFPLADLIKAWTALAGVDVRGYCETHYTSVRFLPSSGTIPTNGFSSSYKLEPQADYITWFRTAHATVPMPMPFVRNPIKASNAATVLALFTQLRRP